MKPYSERRSIEEYVTSLTAAARREIDEGDRLLLTVQRAAELVSVTPWMMYRLLDEQHIKSVYQGRRRYVVVESLRKYVQHLPTTPPY